MTFDFDGALALLVAIVRQWAIEARRNPDELHDLAAWLGMSPAQVADALSGMPNASKPSRRRDRPCIKHSATDKAASDFPK